MPRRNSRVRLVALLVLGLVLFVLYTRNTEAVDDYREYYAKTKEAIGGGAVIRPKPEEAEEAQAPPIDTSQEKTEEAEPVFETWAPPPAVAATTTESLSASNSVPALTSGSSIVALSPPAPTPAPIVQQPIEQEGEYPYELGEGRLEVSVVPKGTSSVIHWSKQPEHFPISSTIQLPSKTSIPFPRLQKSKELAENGVDEQRLAIVKGVAVHAWSGYKQFAWAEDELKPVSGGSKNPFNAWGATLVDSLDTLWMMGMKTEFEEAVEAVKKIDFTTSPRSDIPVFETTIRYLGGLIAAYDVSGKKYISLLDKAVELGEILYSIFDTPNRMPQTFYRWKPAFASQPHRADARGNLAEVGSLSLEFTRLAQLTGEPKYYDAVARITNAFEIFQNNTRIPGMWPTGIDISGCGKPGQMASMNVKEMPGEVGKLMMASQPVQAGQKDRYKDLDLDSLDADDLRRPFVQDPAESAKPVAGGAETGAEKPAPGIVGKIQGFNDPIKEGQVSDNKALGSSKRKRTPPEFLPGGREASGQGLTGQDVCIPQGMTSINKNVQETYTLSGASDSMYEYLVKEYLLLGGHLEQYKTMYLDGMATAIEKLLYKPMTEDERDILATGELRITPNYSQPMESRGYIEKFSPQIAHLACFAGGMFAMGGVIFDKPEHIEIGSKLTDGCVWAYNVTTTGIMPEDAIVMPCNETWGACPWDEAAYWKVLDPHEESRTKAPLEKIFHPTDLPTLPADGEARPAPPAATTTSAPQAKTELERSEEARAADPLAPLPKGKQEEAALDMPTRTQQTPAPADAVPADVVNTAANAIYTPATPLSHADYVAQKIADERLPPGFTKLVSRKYILRPEAIESVFYMYRITGSQYWRDVGWNMFTSIQKHTSSLYGNTAIDDVTRKAPAMKDEMESFWLAETLKYFYLLYDDPDVWTLDEWVFNTEAHLFRRPEFEVKESS